PAFWLAVMERKCIRGGLGTDRDFIRCLAGFAATRERRGDRCGGNRPVGGQGRWARSAGPVAGTLRAVRRLWLSVAMPLVACSVPDVARAEAAVEVAAADEPVLAAGSRDDAPASDPVLARARASMRGGRVPADARARLLASDDPDHRRAA